MAEQWKGRLHISRTVGNGGPYRLDSSLSFSDGKMKVTVREGFSTDGISMPRILRFFVDTFSGVVTPAGVIHDGLYAAQWTSKALADWVFFRAAISCLDLEDKTSRFPSLAKAWNRIQGFFLFLGVFLGGFPAWKRKKPYSVYRAREKVEFFRW